MNVPHDRLLILVIAATGFAVLLAGWAGGLVQAVTGGWTEVAFRVVLALIFIGVLLGVWHEFKDIDEESAE